jgi:hypothetical protein
MINSVTKIKTKLQSLITKHPDSKLLSIDVDRDMWGVWTINAFGSVKESVIISAILFCLPVVGEKVVYLNNKKIDIESIIGLS